MPRHHQSPHRSPANRHGAAASGQSAENQRQQQQNPNQNQNQPANQNQTQATSQNQIAAAKSVRVTHVSSPGTTHTQEALVKYLDEYRSPADARALRDENYEIDYDKLVGVGTSSAVFLAHPANAAPPPVDRATGQRATFTPGYDIAVKIVRLNKQQGSETGTVVTGSAPQNPNQNTNQNQTAADGQAAANRRSLKTRTGSLKLALALGQTKPENNILPVIDVFKTPERIFIFTQYCAFGSVISFIRRNGQVPPKLAQRWSAQMAAALSFLHRFHVAHRNYKLENVLVDDKLDAKLTGFGLSKLCIDLSTKQIVLSRSICGSEPYLAPEMLRDAAERLYDPRGADVWAFGVGVFLVISRKYPFEADNLRALRAEQLAGKYLERDVRRRIRAPVRELLALTFVVDPAARPTIADISLASSWLRGANLVPTTVRSPLSPQNNDSGARNQRQQNPGQPQRHFIRPPATDGQLGTPPSAASAATVDAKPFPPPGDGRAAK